MALLIRGGQALTAQQTFVSADILVEGDRIAAVGPNLQCDGAEVVDASDRIILPGLINAHTHAHNNLSRGRAGRWTLEEHITHGPALQAGLTPEDQYASAAVGAIEMLKTGCTATYDLFMALPAPTEEGIEAVVRAYADSGMRAVLAPSVADIVFYRTVPGLVELLPRDLRAAVEGAQAAPTDWLLDMAESAIRRWDGLASGRIHMAVSPSIPGQCTDRFLAGCVRLAAEYGVSIHTHLVESRLQTAYGVQRWGMSVVAHLAEIGMLGPRFVGAHGVWLTGDDLRLLAESGSSIVHLPASNLRLGSGIAPVRELQDVGVNVALGTDGSLSSDNQNMFESMRFAALISRVRPGHEPASWLGAEEVWEMATSGSARALGVASDVGAIQPGRKADLILLRADSLYLRPLNDPLHALVFAETGANVETVVVDGKVVLEGGRVLGLDERALYDRAQEAAERLTRENQSAWILAERLSPYVTQACSAMVARPVST